MQSLIEKANRGDYFSNLENIQHWKSDWLTPTKAAVNNSNESNLDLNNDDNNENSSERYPFKFKTWLKTETSVFNSDDDELDVLDLATYDRTRKAADSKGSSKTNGDKDGLSMDDIRGAVGGSESIPGLSKSDNPNDNASSTNVDTEVTENKVEEILNETQDTEMNGDEYKSSQIQKPSQINASTVTVDGDVDINMDET